MSNNKIKESGKMENYLIFNGKQIELTEEQVAEIRQRYGIRVLMIVWSVLPLLKVNRLKIS